MAKERQSNFELLRIVAMAGVLTLHACGAAESHGLMLFFALVSVNAFILISGWFKIKLRWKGFLNFIFLIFFWTCVNSLWVVLDSPSIGVLDLMTRMNPFKNWFISCYLQLMLLSPILNGFVEYQKNRGRGVGAFLVLWFAVEFIVDCIIPKKIWGVYSGGYSIFHFIGIYLLGTFLHAHVERGRTLLSQRRWFLMYVGLSLFSYILYKGLDCVCFDSGFARSLTAASQQRLEFYSSPLVIVASATLVMFFSGIKIHSSTINHLAQSMFAVFLAHCPHFYCPRARVSSATPGGSALSGWPAERASAGG